MRTTKKNVNLAIRNINWDEAFNPLMEDVLERFQSFIDDQIVDLQATGINVSALQECDGPAELFDFITHDDYWCRKFTHHLIREVIHQNYGLWE